jgi:hypothetical protein
MKNPNFYGFNLDDVSFTYYSSHSLTVLNGRVSTFQKFVVEFLTFE